MRKRLFLDMRLSSTEELWKWQELSGTNWNGNNLNQSTTAQSGCLQPEEEGAQDQALWTDYRVAK